MIRIQRTTAGIELAVETSLPDWKTRADEFASDDLEAGRHLERSPEHWILIRDFIAEAQYGKCAYCERYLGEEGSATSVDHYRPKGRVTVWRTKEDDFPDRPKGSPSGYYQLTYAIDNYVGACDQCNRKKSSYFPVCGDRQQYTTDQIVLKSERPLLINPTDTADLDPEDIITFYGPLPQIRPEAGSARLRALAAIEILRLAIREDIFCGRCRVLYGVWLAYQNRDRTDVLGNHSRATLAACSKPSAEYSSCAKTYLLLCENNQNEADQLADLMNAYLCKKLKYKKFTSQLQKRPTLRE